MKQIFFIDPLEKLNIKKDSSLMLAKCYQEKGDEVFILFEKDFAITNEGQTELGLYKVEIKRKEDGFYLQEVNLLEQELVAIDNSCQLHMRIDPPYDIRYHRYLWMLDFLRNQTDCSVVNDPLGIMKHNEKLSAYKREQSLKSFVGSSESLFIEFVSELKKSGVKDLILKPLDLYSGIGVEKVRIDDVNLLGRYQKKVQEYQGAIIAQPFQTEVYDGEIRSLYLNGKEIGTIIKKPQKGEFLANIAQGAQFEEFELSQELRKECDDIAQEFLNDGVPFIAYDILAGAVTEINVTCPGLLVEVSYALKKDMAKVIAEAL